MQISVSDLHVKTFRLFPKFLAPLFSRPPLQEKEKGGAQLLEAFDSGGIPRHLESLVEWSYLMRCKYPFIDHSRKIRVLPPVDNAR